MPRFVDPSEVDFLAAHLTAAIRHPSLDSLPVGEATVDDRLLFGLLQAALAQDPRPGIAEYARRLAFDA